MRCALVGAFPFPHVQGSQVFAELQARALARQGWQVSVLTYGGASPAPDDLDCKGIDPRLIPRDTRSGPRWKKPAADLALARRLVALHRERAFDVALAHNAEAAAACLLARPFTRVPVVYIAHTLWRFELSSYAPALFRGPLAGLGAQIDRGLARRADAVVVLCQEAHDELAVHARGPLARIPPALDPAPPPGEEARLRACAKAGVEPGTFSLYTGNLDAYQELPQLAEAARQLDPDRHPVVVASHETRARSRSGHAALRFVHLPDFESVRALTFAAGELVLPRTRPGGFPMKLLNYMESARPILAHENLACGLRHGHSAWLLPRHAGPREIAEGLAALRSDTQRAQQLGARARDRLVDHHGSVPVTRALMAFIGRLTAAKDEPARGEAS